MHLCNQKIRGSFYFELHEYIRERRPLPFVTHGKRTGLKVPGEGPKTHHSPQAPGKNPTHPIPFPPPVRQDPHPPLAHWLPQQRLAPGCVHPTQDPLPHPLALPPSDFGIPEACSILLEEKTGGRPQESQPPLPEARWEHPGPFKNLRNP